MTHTLIKSAIAPQPVSLDQAKQAFGKLVDAYIHELQAWHEHDNQVKAQQPMRLQPQPDDHGEAEDPAFAFWKDFAAWQAEKLARYEPYPAPIAHPDIAAAVATNVGADGKVIYVPDFEIVNDDPTPEQILAAKKAFLLHAVSQAEAEAIGVILLPPGKRRQAEILEADIRAKDNQAAAETQHLADQESRRAKVEAIVRAAAQVMSDIEDLTADNIDTFELPIRFILKTETLPSRGRN